MSIRIVLDNPPEFFTNLDFISGRVILSLHRSESITNVIVKLEGESRTALAVPPPNDRGGSDYYRPRAPGGMGNGQIVTESHKILYRLFQVYPDDGVAFPFQPGQHEFKFNFKVPLNNICHDPKAMSSLLGLGGLGSGFRTMDGTKQLMLSHVKATLPPSLTGFPQEAEIRYYIKVTIQRPGFFRENWRYHVGFKFLPVEPPRPPRTSQEAFARRPFAFRAIEDYHAQQKNTHHKKSSLFFGGKSSSSLASSSASPPGGGGVLDPPKIEMSARIPFPTILTCNEPVPLRLIAKKLAATTLPQQQVYLTSLEIVLVGYTEVRVHNLQNTERSAWVILSAPQLPSPIPLFNSPADPENTEFEVPPTAWKDRRLPNTIAPSFRTCNLARRYEIEIMLSLTWDPSSPSASSSSTASFFASGRHQQYPPQTLAMPLKLTNVEVFSGIKPPPELLTTTTTTTTTNNNNNIRPPRLPSRPSQQQHAQPQRPPDPLYPPQLGTGGATVFEEPPPSYDEAVADSLPGPAARPAYSGVTAENAPSTMPAEKA